MILVFHGYNAAFIPTGEYGVSHFTTGELRSNDFTTGEHRLWTGDFLSDSLFTTCEKMAASDEMLRNKPYYKVP